MEQEIQDFLINLEEDRKLQPRTVDAYERDLESFYRYIKEVLAVERIDVADIDKSLVVGFLREAKDGGGSISANYRNRMLSCLRSFFKFLEDDGKVKSNVAKNVKWAKVIVNDPVALTISEVRKIRRLIEKNSSEFYLKRDLAIWDTLVMTGIRVAELVSLNIEDMDFENQVFLGIVRKGGQKRHHEVCSKVLLSIKRWMYVRKKLGAGEVESGLFLSNRGKRISIRAVQHFMEECCKYAGLAGINKKITPHTLRRTYASIMSQENKDTTTIQEMLGHASIRTTVRYIKSFQENKRDAAAVFDRLEM